MRIAVDAMGGDHAPAEVVAGAVLSCLEPGHEVVLVGDREAVRHSLEALGGPMDRISIEHADAMVGMGESPSAACKRRNTSIAVAIGLLRRGAVQAVVSAGNSGAFMACALLELDRVEGIERPAIAICFPTSNGTRVLLDAGANAACRPQHLPQFARMGRVYAQHALGIEQPTVGLLSIGEEATKGTELTKAAYKLLQEARTELNFVGNVEGDKVFTQAPDVIVCDGFTGNVFLKTAEGTAVALLETFRGAVQGSVWGRLGALFMRGALMKLRQTFDYATYGGALLLGVKGICVVGHGRSDARAIRNAVGVARRAIDGGVIDHIAECGRKPADVVEVSPREDIEATELRSAQSGLPAK
jgi:glycerol-3-phosphate acyltransferase PlsX